MALHGRTALITGSTSGIEAAGDPAKFIGMDGLATYGASKAALESLTKAWTAEYASQGVRVNAVAPGPTRTPASAATGEVFDVLASDDASFIYGALLPADGGRVAV